MERWTIEKLKDWPKDYLTPQQVGDVLGTDPNWYRLAARDQPQLIPFPFVRNGSRTKFPKIPFLRWMGVNV